MIKTVKERTLPMPDYSREDTNLMLLAAQARNKSRLQELIDYAKLAGYTRLGLANCKAVQPYADKLAERLRQNGFEVYAMNCKESGLDGCFICEACSGPCCDPLSQAQYLNDCQTELNINVGLCLGHGLLFQKYSHAPVTTFLVKDFAHNHNMSQALD
jgi:uncharacterized metal-binding protein